MPALDPTAPSAFACPGAVGTEDNGQFVLPPHTILRLEIDQGRTIELVWGAFWHFGTAAYWVSQYLRRFGPRPIPRLALGRSLLEETAACLLGGYGVPAEVGLAAFRLVRDRGLLDGRVRRPHEFRRVLRHPVGGEGEHRGVRYRFLNQRAARLAAATRYFSEHGPAPTRPLDLRTWLGGINGIGPKTSAWIVRNHTACDDVAIIDVHIHRAGLRAGFFPSSWRLPKDYARFERAFLAFARATGVPASGLDALIWDEQRILTARRPSARLLK